MAIRQPLSALSTRLLRLPSTLLVLLFGLALVASVWVYVIRFLASERAAEIERIHRDNGAMATAFEEHVRRVLQSADATLLFLKHEFEEAGRPTDELAGVVEAARRDPAVNQIAVADAAGDLVASAVPLRGPVNVADTEDFRQHAGGDGGAGMHVGKPIVNRTAGRWSVFLSRRLSRPDGAFAGIVAIGLDPDYFSRFYEGLELGVDRGVILVGRDGVVRARRFQRETAVGQHLHDSPMFDRIPEAATGHYEVVGVIDQRRRFVSYRAMPDYPLVVAVSDLTSSALAPFERRQRAHRRSALAFTLFVGAFCVALAAAGRRERRRDALLAAGLSERLRTQEALREAGERYRDLFENANDAIFLLDERHRYVDANRRAVELFGYERGEFLGRSVLEFIPPEQVQRSEAAFRELAASGGYERFEGRMQRKDGQWRDIEVSSSAIVRDGAFVGSRDIVRDVTERKSAAEEASRLLNAVSVATVGIAITDARDRFVFVNAAHAAIFGYGPDELLGKTWRATVPAELVPLFERELAKTLHDPAVGRWAGECPGLRKDGASIPTEITATARWDGKGAYLGHICIVRDVTERKQAEAKIREGELFIRGILDTVDEGFIVVDRDFRILTANKAYCDQVSRAAPDVIGRHCFEVSHGSARPCAEAGERCAVRLTFETGQPHAAVHRHAGPGGMVLFVETKAFPIRDDAGNVASVIETVNNITERHLLEEERLKSQKLESIGTLAGGIAHDFNNLLQGIFGYISMAKMCADDPGRALVMLEQAERALHQSVSLTTQLLTFSKGGRPVRVPLDLGPVIENAVKFALSGSRAGYRLALDPGLWRADADAGQIGQVIQNIVMNADQAMPEGGSVDIAARNVPADDPALPPDAPRRDHVAISIRDSGVGIRQEDLDRIFDPYFTTKERGTGLGLATSYSIVRNHDGRITARSEPGAGSTFEILLPASEAPAEAAAEPAVAAGSRAARVLVMDDEEIVRNVAGELLRVLGHSAVPVDRGEAAIDAYVAAREAGRPFDAVILDLTIRGGMGGVETAARLRAIDPDARLVASSGYSDDAALAGYRQQGFAAFLKKPYNLDRLREALDPLLG